VLQASVNENSIQSRPNQTLFLVLRPNPPENFTKNHPELPECDQTDNQRPQNSYLELRRDSMMSDSDTLPRLEQKYFILRKNKLSAGACLYYYYYLLLKIQI